MPGAPVWEALKEIEKWLKTQTFGTSEAEISPEAYLVNPEQIYLAKGVIVEPGAYIKGPVWIGENSIVRHGAYIRGNVIAGKGVVIGHDTEVKNSLFLDGAHAAHFAYVGDSILGTKVNLGAGVKLANLKLNSQEVAITGTRTGLRKFGSIIGDNCQIGCNAVLNPGTLVGMNSFIHPLVNVGGIIPVSSSVSQKLSIVVSPIK